jgi:hypothetical protein
MRTSWNEPRELDMLSRGEPLIGLSARVQARVVPLVAAGGTLIASCPNPFRGSERQRAATFIVATGTLRSSTLHARMRCSHNDETISNSDAGPGGLFVSESRGYRDCTFSVRFPRRLKDRGRLSTS